MTSTEVAVAAPEPYSMYRAQIEKAQMLAKSDIVPEAYRQKPANILVAMEMAEALHITLFQAMQGVHTIKGRLAMYAELMRALVLRDGHTLKIDALTATGCRILAARQGDTELVAFEFTMVDATTAGLHTEPNYKKHPKAMLLARCTSLTCRAIFPDVIAGIGYTPDELRDELGHNDEPPAPKVVGRKVEKPAPKVEAMQVPVDLPPGVWVDESGVVHSSEKPPVGGVE
jgi:hypothetical protein